MPSDKKRPPAQPTSASPGPRRLGWLIISALVLLTAIPFARVCWHDFVNYDDPQYVSENKMVQQGLTARSVWWALTTFDVVNWHPLTWLSYQLDRFLCGPGPAGFHGTNLLLHLANAALLFAALRSLTGKTGPAAFAAALFALHPLRVEPVAWISARKDLLSTFFFLLVLLAYARYVRRPRIASYLLVAGLCALGLMAKTSLVTLPCVLLLLDAWPLRRFDLSSGLWTPALRRCLVEKVPLLLLAMGAAVLAWYGQQEGHGQRIALPLSTRILIAPVLYVQYLGEVLYPINLLPFHPYPTAPLPAWQLLGSVLLLLVLTVAAVRLARTRPYVLVGWLWFLGTMLPTSGIVEILGGQGRADRYTYLPSIGLFVIAAWGVDELLSHWPRRTLVYSFAASVLAAYLVLDWIDVGHWRDSTTLWSYTLAAEPDNYYAHLRWGDVLFEKGDLQGAARHYDEARRLNPTSSLAYGQLARLAFSQGRLDPAIEYLRKGIALNPRDSGMLVNLGQLFLRKGLKTEALECFRQAVACEPHHVEARIDLSIALHAEGKVSEAIQHCREALELDPSSLSAHMTLARYLAQQGQLEEALQHSETALRIDDRCAPAHHALAVLLEQSHQPRQALEHYAEAVRLDPSFAAARRELARCLVASGKLDEAIQQYQALVRQQPREPEPWRALGMVHLVQGDWHPAASCFRQVVALRPNVARYHCQFALALQQGGNGQEAEKELQEASRIDPDWPRRSLKQAWQLATSPRGSRREGRMAVLLAKQAGLVLDNREPHFLDTLAAAYAQAGKYDRAREIAAHALRLASSSTEADAIRERLAYYVRSQPFHRSPGMTAP